MQPQDPTQAKGPSLVRPYFLTAGRTEAAVDLPIEATLVLQPSAREKTWPAGDMGGRIVALCSSPQSVAEISAKLGVPLGVARVLIGDLVAQAHLRTQATLTENSSTDERRDLIERTLSGLRAL
jgi:hypothetical protein